MASLSPQAPELRRPWLMQQDWQHLTFVHWAIDPALVADMMPRGVRPDTLDGASYVGLIPFRMHDAGPGRGPGVPYLGTFAETNVRLYSVDEHGRHGVVFRSLETTRLAVVLGARGLFGTPYMWARMSIDIKGDVITYSTRRRLPGPRGGGGTMRVRVGAPIAEPSELEVFLTARFGLHTSWLGRPLWIPNAHPPWSLRQATLEHLDDGLVAAAGLPGIVGATPDSVVHSTGVRTEFGFPRRV